MRVGLSGASGFIGSALAAALEERGDEVIAFVRPGRTSARDRVRWDPRRRTLDAADLERVGALDAVVNLAGAGIGDRRWSDARRRELVASRQSSTELAVEAATATAATHLVSASAIGYYGARRDDVLVETSAPGTDFLAQLCVMWESLARSAPGSVTVTQLRTGIVLDSTGGALARQLPLFRLGLGGRLGSGTQWVSPISLHDEVRAILWILDHRPEGPVNLCAPQSVTNADLTRALARALRRPAVAHVPRWALDVALGAALVNGAILASQRVVPQRLLEAGFAFEDPEIDSIVARAVRRA